MASFIYIVALSFITAFPIGVIGGMWLMWRAVRISDDAYDLKMQRITDMENDEDLHQ